MSELTPHAGYVSEQSKRTFTIWAGLLGVLFFVLQMFAPMLAMFAIMPGFVFDSKFVSYGCCGGQALFDGQLYLVEKTTSAGFEQRRETTRLVRLTGAGVEEVAPLGEGEPRLLATPGRLLLISPRRVGSLEGGRLVEVETRPPLGEISVPFLFDGSPAVVESLPDRRRLLLWSGSEWIEARSYAGVPDAAGSRFLALEGQLLELHCKGSNLYSRNLDREESWVVVTSGSSAWTALVLDGRPAVAVAGGEQLRLYLLADDGWNEARSAPLPGSSPGLLEVFQETPGGPPLVLTGSYASRLRFSEWGESGLEERLRAGGVAPFPSSIFAFMAVAQTAPAVLSLLLAVVLSALMRTHRVGELTVGGRTVAHASLTRRALAQLVDGAIVLAPLAALGVRMFRRFEEFFEGPDVLWMFGAMGAVLLWILLVFVAFSVGEGRWGLTPGKWVTGIRVVGTDLAPCGFGRAIVRNLLKLVDGFFNFLIGILMVAFTPEWQRLGDLAARTIVIHGRLEPTPASPSPGPA